MRVSIDEAIRTVKQYRILLDNIKEFIQTKLDYVNSQDKTVCRNSGADYNDYRMQGEIDATRDLIEELSDLCIKSLETTT